MDAPKDNNEPEKRELTLKEMMEEERKFMMLFKENVLAMIYDPTFVRAFEEMDDSEWLTGRPQVIRGSNNMDYVIVPL